MRIEKDNGRDNKLVRLDRREGLCIDCEGSQITSILPVGGSQSNYNAVTSSSNASQGGGSLLLDAAVVHVGDPTDLVLYYARGRISRPGFSKGY